MCGMAFGIQVVVDGWNGKMDQMMVPLDIFDMILSNNFFCCCQSSHFATSIWLADWQQGKALLPCKA